MHELDDRCVVGGLAQVDDLQRAGLVLPLLDGLLNRVLKAVHPRDQGGDVLPGGDRGLDVHPCEQRDVVDGEDVRRVGHRQEDRAIVDERHRHRRIPFCR